MSDRNINKVDTHMHFLRKDMEKTQMNISSIRISFFVHATEDIDKMLTDLSDAFSLRQDDVVCESVEGHFRNTITSVKAHAVGENAKLVARSLISRLSDRARSSIVAELGKSMDEHDSLYLRFDRQSLHRKLELGDDEPIRVKLKPKYRLADRISTTKAYAELLR